MAEKTKKNQDNKIKPSKIKMFSVPALFIAAIDIIIGLSLISSSYPYIWNDLYGTVHVNSLLFGISTIMLGLFLAWSTFWKRQNISRYVFALTFVISIIIIISLFVLSFQPVFVV